MATLAGKILYTLYHRPRGAVWKCLREGGPWQQRRTEQDRRAMERAAQSLPAPPPAEGPPLPVHVLTGRAFWYQTAFCLWTLARHSQRLIAPVIYDDGSLRGEQQEILARLFPLARFLSPQEARAPLDSLPPASRYPALRDRWTHYPNIRKLIAPHLGSTGWKLVIDSDLLFFRRPDALLAWLEAPAAPLHAIDHVTSYGYSRALLESLAGTSLAERVNVGLCGLDSAALDWDRLEHWCRTLLEREGTHYFLEQALVAMLVAGRPCTILPADDYVTLPRLPEAAECRAIMHHYVADSKRWYFRHCWRRALAASPGPAPD